MNIVTRRQALGTLGALALPWEQLFAQTGTPPAVAAAAPVPPTPALPDLANFHPVMEWIAQQRSLRLSFLDSQWRDLETWKRAAREEFVRCLSFNPPAPAPRAELVGREERDGFTLESLKLHVSPAYHIPARVLVPKGRSGRLPAVVGIHDHGGRYTWGQEKIISYPNDSATLLEVRERGYGRPWAEVLAKRGYVVIVIDGFYFGSRRLRVEDLQADRVIPEAKDAHKAALAAKPDSPEWHRAISRVCYAYEHLTAKNLITAGATWPGLHVWDDLRSVDYLVSRPDVDPERIGCAGLSIGGLRTAHLIAADPRIKAASITGWMTQFPPQLRNHLRNHTWMIFVPGLYDVMDFPDLAAIHAPGALLVQQCRRDLLYPLSAMEGAVDQLKRIYAKAGVPERFRGTFYDEPHTFRPYMQDETFDWFDRWL